MKAKVSEISNPSALSSSRGRQKVRGVSSPKRRGRGRAAYSNRNEKPASPCRSSRHTSPPPPTSSVARGTRGWPRGSRGTRLGRQEPGSQGTSPGCAPSRLWKWGLVSDHPGITRTKMSTYPRKTQSKMSNNPTTFYISFTWQYPVQKSPIIPGLSAQNT